MAFRWGFVSCIALLSVSWACAAQAQAPRSVEAWIQALASDNYDQRSNAGIELTLAGPPAVEALLKSAASSDPEVAWRADEALELMCRSTSLEAEQALRTAIAQAARSQQPAVAQRAKELLKKWPRYRHDYAAGQLELRGARVGESGDPGYMEADFGGPMPGGFPGGFFGFGGGFGGGGFVAPLADGDLVVLDDDDAAFEIPPGEEAIEIEIVPDEAGDEAIAEDFPAADEEPAPQENRGGGGGIFGAIGRALGGARAADDAAAEALGDALVERLGAGLERFDAPAVDDVEFLLPPPDVVEVDGIEMLGGPFGDVWDTGESYDPNNVPPQTLVLDENWRGGDDGLRFAAHLQNIYTVHIHNAQLTDAALSQLANMRSLASLEITGTSITGAGLHAFKRARPNVSITALGDAVLGVTGQDDPRGVIVHQVLSETGARRAGLAEGDIITHLGGHRIRTFGDLTVVVYDKHPGDKLAVQYLRGNKKHECLLELTAREDLPLPTVPAGYGNSFPEQHIQMQMHMRMRAVPLMEMGVPAFDW